MILTSLYIFVGFLSVSVSTKLKTDNFTTKVLLLIYEMKISGSSIRRNEISHKKKKSHKFLIVRFYNNLGFAISEV